MFPIRDARGRTIGFGGRALGDGEPKYLNSPETGLFHIVDADVEGEFPSDFTMRVHQPPPPEAGVPGGELELGVVHHHAGHP